MITDDPVGVCGGCALCVRAGNLSVKRVVESLEKTLAQVHIADGVNALGEVDAAGNLTIAVAPVMLDALQVPLVDQDDDLLALALVDLSEEVFITLVHEDLLELGEENAGGLNVPVNQVLIQALLCEGLRVSLMNLLAVGQQLLRVECLRVLEALHEVVRHVHSRLVVQTIGRHSVQLVPEEVELCADLLSCLTSILDLDAREPEFEVEAESVVELEGVPVEGPSREEDELSEAPIVLEPVRSILVQVFVISVQFLLGVHELQKLGLRPPPITDES